MKTLDRMTDGPWQKYHGPNLGYIQDQYEKFCKTRNLWSQDTVSCSPAGTASIFGKQ